jgi:hypothetical protein
MKMVVAKANRPASATPLTAASVDLVVRARLAGVPTARGVWAAGLRSCCSCVVMIGISRQDSKGLIDISFMSRKGAKAQRLVLLRLCVFA